MAHPFVDPRLLTTLLADAREYHKHLSVLLDTYAQHSLLSLSAYASTSPAPVARAVIAVAGSFAGADDALRRYANSVEAWQTELQAIKGLEEEMSNATRDREILVTRLLEQSRSQRTRKPSTTTLGSSNSGSMADAAQEELRVSDRELTVKKQRLSALRTAALRDGLHRRCEAMIECGQTWADMGKAGMRVLEGIIDVGEDQLEDPLLGVPGTTLAQPEISRVPSHSPTVLKIQSRISTRGSAQPIAQTLPKDSLLLEPLSIPPRMPSTQTLPAPFPITPPSPRRPRSRQQPLIVTKQRSRSRSSSRSRPKSPGNVMLPPPSLDWNTVTRQNASHRPRRHPSPPTILQPRPVSPRQPTLIQPQPQRPTIIYPGTPPSPASPPAHEPIVLPPPTREPNYPRPLSLVDEGPEIDFEQAVRQRRDRWGRTTPVVPAIPGLGSSSTWYQPPYLLPQPMPQIIPPTFIPPTFIPPTFIPPPVTIMTDSDDDDTTVKVGVPHRHTSRNRRPAKISRSSSLPVRSRTRTRPAPPPPVILPPLPPGSATASERERRVRAFFRGLAGIFKSGDKPSPESYYQYAPYIPAYSPTIRSPTILTIRSPTTRTIRSPTIRSLTPPPAPIRTWRASNPSVGYTHTAVSATAESQQYTSYSAYTRNTQQSQTSRNNYYIGPVRATPPHTITADGSSLPYGTQSRRSYSSSRSRSPRIVVVNDAPSDYSSSSPRSRSPSPQPIIVQAPSSWTPSPSRTHPPTTYVVQAPPRQYTPSRSRSRSHSPERTGLRSSSSPSRAPAMIIVQQPQRRYRSRSRSPTTIVLPPQPSPSKTRQAPRTIVVQQPRRRHRSRSPHPITPTTIVMPPHPSPSKSRQAPRTIVVQQPRRRHRSRSPQPIIIERAPSPVSLRRTPRTPATIVLQPPSHYSPQRGRSRTRTPRVTVAEQNSSPSSSVESYGRVLTRLASPESDASSEASYATGVEDEAE